jgi:hypothetical protein
MGFETGYTPGLDPAFQKGLLRGEYRQNGEQGRKGLIFALIVLGPSLILFIFTLHMNQTTRDFLWGYSWVLYMTAVGGFITAAIFAFINFDRAFNSHNYRTLQIYDNGFEISDNTGWQGWYDWSQLTSYTNASSSKLDKAGSKSTSSGLGFISDDPVGWLFGLALLPVIWGFSLVWKQLHPLETDYRLILETTDGLSYEFNNEYNGIESLVTNLETALIPPLAARLKKQLEEGQSLKMGDLEISQNGLDLGEKTCQWDQVSAAYLRGDEIVIKTRQDTGTSYHYGDAEFATLDAHQPNATVLQKLVSELGSQIRPGSSW